MGGQPAKEGTYPSRPPPPRRHPASPPAWRAIPGPGVCAGGQARRGGRAARWAGRWLPPTPAPSPPPADSVRPGLRVCVCVSALPPRLLQFNPSQTRGPLTGRHDEAESEADSWPAAGLFPFPTPTPNPATHAHTHSPSSLLNSQSLKSGGRGSTDNRGVTTPAFPKHLYLPLITYQHHRGLWGPCLPGVLKRIDGEGQGCGLDARIGYPRINPLLGRTEWEDSRNQVLSTRDRVGPWVTQIPRGQSTVVVSGKDPNLFPSWGLQEKFSPGDVQSQH